MMDSKLERDLACQLKQIEEATQEIKGIQTKIKNGGSTGDVITDFCIIHYGLDYNQYTEKLQNLESELKTCENEVVLVERSIVTVNNYGKPGACYIVSPVHIHDSIELQSGIIKGPEFLLLKEEQLSSTLAVPYFEITIGKRFTMPKRASFWPKRIEWDEDYKNITIKSREFFKEPGLYNVWGFDAPRNEFGPVSGEYFKSLKIFVGNQEVEEYFTEREYPDGFIDLRKIVGI